MPFGEERGKRFPALVSIVSMSPGLSLGIVASKLAREQLTTPLLLTLCRRSWL